jgi:hypothetical protein
MKNEYRVIQVVGDDWYRAQIRFWWLPLLWFDLSGSHSPRIGDAEVAARTHADPVVKNLGKLPPD